MQPVEAFISRWDNSGAAEPLTAKENRGRDAHAPCDALLTRLVALNHERAAEEKRGLIRKLIAGYDKSVVTPYDAESLSAVFVRKIKKRSEQIEGTLETRMGSAA